MLTAKHIAAALPTIKKWEGLRLEAYRDHVGVWTIGYGTTAAAGLGITPRAGMKITQAQADELLRRGVEKFAARIAPGFTRRPTASQGGALLSLAYNIGPGAFLKSTALARFNAGDLSGAAAALQWFNKAGGRVVRGLVNRRKDEAALFLRHSSRAAPVRSTPGASGFLAAILRAILAAFAK